MTVPELAPALEIFSSDFQLCIYVPEGGGNQKFFGCASRASG